MVTIHCLGSGLVGSFVIKKLSTLGVKINVIDIEETNYLIENDLIKIPSTRGTRYFGPSKMSFSNLLSHSLSIISVFKKTVLIRSALFIVLYILLIKSNASVITAVPLILLLIMIYSISNLALRENMEEFNDSLKNILDITKIK